ncbi:hypothetical protein NDR89_20555 [Cupriavidus gilardii]|uniref:Uncharacterized protein n=1 Tax=Cupriavidus gilardii TaxID=82541 RepID=A0ABY4VPR8_9BURK|nr:hypothetical protein [Cupriavidus gilardii]USE79031.1 hypothetical protein NDR89_20555 [Cupriavidus gilardii]
MTLWKLLNLVPRDPFGVLQPVDQVIDGPIATDLRNRHGSREAGIAIEYFCPRADGRKADYLHRVPRAGVDEVPLLVRPRDPIPIHFRHTHLRKSGEIVA